MLEIVGKDFYNDGKKITIISGAIHYFRMFKQQYRDRLLKLKACGFNTVETYVAWNLHEPKKGQFVFEDYHSLKDFLDIAKELELMVILRPGPYICAEWEFGGLPSWILEDKNMQLRCFYEPYLKHVDDWFDVIIPYIKPYLQTNGGNIIAVQVENEYGSYGDDKRYLKYIKDGLIKRGVNVLLFTSDGPVDHMLTAGCAEDALITVNFGSRANTAFDTLEQHQNNKPLMCMEFWNGWFDHWKEQHHLRDAQEVAEVFSYMLKRNANVNFYMFHGGTNFGFMNGANCFENYEPTVTSYDYDALLTEAGDITEKYKSIRRVIEANFGSIDLDIPPDLPKKSYGKIKLTECAELFKNLTNISEPIESVCTEPMEKYGQSYGYILYSKKIYGVREELPLKIIKVHDRATIFADGIKLGVYTRDGEQNIKLSVPKEGVQLDILVENQGRTNYGPYSKDYKGITDGVCLQLQFLFDYKIYNLEMDNLSNLMYEQASIKNMPTFYKGNLEIQETYDTFIKLDGFKKGIVFVNGFNLGRYWEAGPTKTLYVPAPLLKVGINEVIVFEEEGCTQLEIESIAEPIL